MKRTFEVTLRRACFEEAMVVIENDMDNFDDAESAAQKVAIELASNDRDAFIMWDITDWESPEATNVSLKDQKESTT